MASLKNSVPEKSTIKIPHIQKSDTNKRSIDKIAGYYETEEDDL